MYLFPSNYLSKLFYVFRLSYMFTSPTHLIHDYITKIICDKEYKLYTPSLFSFLHLESNVPLSLHFLNTLCSSRKFYTQNGYTHKFSFVYSESPAL